MTLKLERTKVLVDAYGEMVELSKPSLYEVIELEDRLKIIKEDGKAVIKEMIEFLKRRGFPENLISSMEPDHIAQVIEALSGKKKDLATEG